MTSTMAVTTPQCYDRDFSARQYAVLVAAVTAIGAALRFYGLGIRGLWIDEGYSWGITQLTRAEFVHGLGTRALDMAVYYILLRCWSVLGSSEFLLRSLSATVSILTIPVVAEVGRLLYSRKAGVLAGASLAVHVFALEYAQEARSYSLVLFFAALGWLQLVRIARKPSDGNWAWFALISTLEFYSHFLSLLNIAAQLLTLLWLAPLKTNFRTTFRGLGLLAIGILPGLAYAVKHTSDVSWIPPISWSSIRDFLDLVAGGIGSRIYLGIVLVLYLALCCEFVWQWRRHGRGMATWRLSIPVIGFAFPVLTLFVASLHQSLFLSRYLLFTILPLIWGIAHLCFRFRPYRSLILSTLVLVTLASAIPAYYKHFTLAPVRFQDLRGAAQYISARQQPGDAMLMWEPIVRPGLEFYARGQSQFPERLFPGGAHFTPEDLGARPDPTQLRASLRQHPRIWVVRLATDLSGQKGWAVFLESSAQDGRRLLSEFRSTGIIVREYTTIDSVVEKHSANETVQPVDSH